LAEDNLTNQRVALLLLEKLGYGADVVDNGQEVLEALAQNAYDLVLMDLQMPGVDGLETTGHILQRFAPGHRPKIIALTANALIGDREKCLAAGMDDYLSKPIRLEALGQLLARYQLPPTPDKTQPKARLDLSLLWEAANGDEQALHDVIDVMLKTLPDKLASLKAGIASGNPRQVEIAAHMLKSDSALFNQTRLSELCASLEGAGSARQFQEAIELFKQVEAEWRSIQEALQAAQAGLRPLPQLG
jgi:CheY-like chemotaxis protein